MTLHQPTSCWIRLGRVVLVLVLTTAPAAAVGARNASAVDRDQRASLYYAAQEILIHDVPVLWLAEMKPVRAFKSTFHGLSIWSGNLAEAAWQDNPQ